jgi:hypothetical protein
MPRTMVGIARHRGAMPAAVPATASIAATGGIP